MAVTREQAQRAMENSRRVRTQFEGMGLDMANGSDHSAIALVYAMGADKAPPGELANASKKDVGKPPVVRGFLNYFPRAIQAVAMVSEYGDRKYSTTPGLYPVQFLDVPDGQRRYADGLGRHLLKQATEGPYDDTDSGLAHAAQVAWNAMTVLEKLLRDGGLEMRRGNDIVDGSPVLGTASKVSL